LCAITLLAAIYLGAAEMLKRFALAA